MKKIGIKFLDIFVFIFILFLGFFLTFKTISNSGSSVIVDANGNRYEYSLEKDGIYSVQGALGLTTFEIKNGVVHILDSACPNKTCVAQGWSSSIICLPNKVIIQIVNDGEIDAISQ